MSLFARRRDDRYDDRYYERPRGRGYGYRRRSPGGSCVRDACLLDTGCCVAESLDGNCLLLGVLALPHFFVALRRPGVKEQNISAGLAGLMVAAIGVYQREISPRRAGCCRLSPTCSEYGAQAIQRHGARRGLALTGRRLLRCRPGGRGGPDPVPAAD